MFENQLAGVEFRTFNRAQQGPSHFERLCSSIHPKQDWRELACVTVGQFSETTVDLREKYGDERRNRPEIAEMAIDLGGDQSISVLWNIAHGH